MILTDYYRLEVLKPTQSHRMDCTASTGEYPLFEAMAARSKVGRLFLYVTKVPDRFTADAQRRADRILSNCTHLSSIYVPDLEMPNLGYGDVAGTEDALLLKFSGEGDEALDLYVARGYKNNALALFQLWTDGGLDEEVATLQQRAVSTGVELQTIVR